MKPQNLESSDFTDNEKCMLKILETARENGTNSLSTNDILKMAVKFDICADCSAGSQVVSAGEKLIERKMVEKFFAVGGYRWKLNNFS